MPVDPEELGARFHRAYRDAEPLDPASLPSDLTVEQGYEIQDAFLERRLGDGGVPVGYKVGFTSEATRSELAVDAPTYGRVLADTVREDRRFDADALVDPRVEPEIALLLGSELSPPVSRHDVVAATRLVAPAVEVVDSRVRDWTLTAPTAVADNSLAARLLLGDRPTTGDVDLAREGVELLVDGERRATGTGAAVLGHPADAVAWLADALSARGDALRAGDVVTTGSITEPVPVASGETVVARFSSLGTVVAHAE
jgi:2-keto-4-pentenoate hydratase